MLQVKNTILDMKNSFDVLISRLKTVEKTSEFADMSIEITQAEDIL